MLINAMLLAKDPAIIAGLADGSLNRFGSVIRSAATGQIVRHLAEAPGFGQKVITLAANPILGAAAIVTDAIGHGATAYKLNNVQKSLNLVQQSLSSVLGLTQIAAGASVLNLGISIAGFAYMGYKLNQVQTSLDKLQNSMESGFNRIEERLDRISGQLAYLHLLVEENRQEQQRLGQAISELHSAFLIREIADLQAEIVNRDRFPDSSAADTLKVAARSRIFLANQAMQAQPELNSQTMLITDVATQGWAVATATEAYLLLEIGKIQDARQLLAYEIPRFQALSTRWAEALLNDREYPELETAYRFSAPRFAEHISRDRIERIARISPRDRALSSDQIRRKQKDIEVEFEMFYVSQLNQQWTHRQVAIAEYLDTFSELSARLESLQAFADLCDSKGVKSSRELLPDTNAEPGLYLLPVSDEFRSN